MDRDFKRRTHRPYADMVTPRRPAPSVSAQAALATAEASQQPSQLKARASVRKKRWLILGGATLVFVCSGIAGFVYIHQDRTPLDKYAKQYSFPLYYPSEMPHDYELTTSSIKPSGNILVYSLSNPAKKSTIAITQQATPPGFDIAKLGGKDIAPLSLSSGTLYNLSIGDVTKYILTAKDGTLVFINSQTKVDSETVNSLASSLQRAN